MNMVYTSKPHAGRDLFASFGIGSLSQEIDKAFASSYTTNYPPYNVIKFNDNEYSLQFAVAGFRKEDIDISIENNVLTIKGERPEDNPEVEYLHKGIAGRKFIRQFTLPKYFEVEKAGMDNGILYVDLVRNIPEEKKPKKIAIS